VKMSSSKGIKKIVCELDSLNLKLLLIVGALRKIALRRPMSNWDNYWLLAIQDRQRVRNT